MTGHSLVMFVNVGQSQMSDMHALSLGLGVYIFLLDGTNMTPPVVVVVCHIWVSDPISQILSTKAWIQSSDLLKPCLV